LSLTQILAEKTVFVQALLSLSEEWVGKGDIICDGQIKNHHPRGRPCGYRHIPVFGPNLPFVCQDSTVYTATKASELMKALAVI